MESAVGAVEDEGEEQDWERMSSYFTLVVQVQWRHWVYIRFSDSAKCVASHTLLEPAGQLPRYKFAS